MSNLLLLNNDTRCVCLEPPTDSVPLVKTLLTRFTYTSIPQPRVWRRLAGIFVETKGELKTLSKCPLFEEQLLISDLICNIYSHNIQTSGTTDDEHQLAGKF